MSQCVHVFDDFFMGLHSDRWLPVSEKHDGRHERTLLVFGTFQQLDNIAQLSTKFNQSINHFKD